MGPIWDPYGGPLGPYGAPWAPWAMADGPWPMGLKDPGLEDPPVGVYFRARGRWGPMGSMGLGDPPMGVSSYRRPHGPEINWEFVFAVFCSLDLEVYM